MSKYDSPAFQFYPRDFLSDGKVAAMTNEQIGAYWKLVCYCWIEDGLPDDVDELASLAGAEPIRFRTEIWPKVERCFRRTPGGGLYHQRLSQERSAQQKKSWKKVTAGRLGAKKRWDKSDDEFYSNGIAEGNFAIQSWGKNRWNKPSDNSKLDSSAMFLPMANDSSSSSTTYKSGAIAPPSSVDDDVFVLSSEPISKNGNYSAVQYFETVFWPAVWRKVGKGDALKAFRRVAKTKAAAERITAAAKVQGPLLIDAALKSKREALHPSTWLNGGRYEDELTQIDAQEEDPW